MPRGLSPRVRGNLGRADDTRITPGSIPACAGEPALHSIGSASVRIGWDTLSPRVRGNPSRKVCQQHGGEPRQRHGGQVYPRVCGGTDKATLPWGTEEGLSPRVRGNRCVGVRAAKYTRSIPACAGEPQRRVGHRRAQRIYPRVCGGTPPAQGVNPVVNRSIPACAGEPELTQLELSVE